MHSISRHDQLRMSSLNRRHSYVDVMRISWRYTACAKWTSYLYAFESYRITAYECVQLVRRGHFRSRGEGGGHMIGSATAVNPMLQSIEANLITIFIALDGKQTRSSDDNSVCFPCLYVRVSACQTHGLWQNGRKISTDFYTIQKNI